MRKLALTVVALAGLVAGGCVHHPYYDNGYYHDRQRYDRHDGRYDYGRYDRYAGSTRGYRYGDYPQHQRDRSRYYRPYGDDWY